MTVNTADEAGLEAWRAMLLAHSSALHAIGIVLNDAGHIPLTWYDVLIELKASPGGRLRMSELGERVTVSRSQVSRIVDQMAAAGLVTRTADSRDGRAKYATITEKGAEAVRVTAPVYLRGIEQHFSRYLTADEKSVLATALMKVRDAHNEIKIGG